MSDVKKFFNQQFGFSTWRNYDSSLQRLHCLNAEDFTGLTMEGEGDSQEYDTPVFACKFATKKGNEHLLALANEDGKLYIRDSNQIDNNQTLQVHQNAIFDLTWLCDSLKLITVSGDHTARLVNVENGEMQVEQVFTGHSRSVKTVTCRKNDPSVFSTGSRDGNIRVWDTRCAQSAGFIVHSDRTIQNSHYKMTPTSSTRKKLTQRTGNNCGPISVTGLVFQNDETLISCGSGDGFIKVWDLRKTYTTSKREPQPKCEIPYHGNTSRNAFSNLTIDEKGLRLYANCLDNTIYCYNLASYDINPIIEYKGHQNSSFYVKSALSHDGLYLLSGSSDQNAYIWNINNSEPIVRLYGHTAEVTCVAWRKKGDIALITCGDDIRNKIWRIGPEITFQNDKNKIFGQAEFINRTPSRIKRILEINENTPIQEKRFKCDTGSKRSREDTALTDPKRFNSGRRLFELTNNPSCSNDDDLATILEEEELFKTPTGNSTKKIKLMQSTPPETFSPTSNLPNFVKDGVAPHLHFSPQKRVDKDWLTKMRIEKRLKREMLDLTSSGPSSPKILKLEERSPRNRITNRRSSQTRAQSPILKFFRVTNNSILNGGQCSPKLSVRVDRTPNPSAK